ncbi:methyl-accepting chemotaxis protein [Colwelliaceae bacterium 6441]
MKLSLSAVNRISVGFTTIITFLLIISYSGITSIQSINTSLTKINEQAAPINDYASRLSLELVSVNLLMYQHYNATDSAKHGSINQQYISVKQALQENISTLSAKLSHLESSTIQSENLTSLSEQLTQIFNKIEVTMSLSQDALNDFNQIDKTKANIAEIQRKINQKFTVLKQLKSTRNTRLLLSEAEQSVNTAFSIAKLLATTQNYNYARELSSEFTQWLTAYVELAFKINEITESKQHQQLIKSLGLLVGELAFAIDNESGLVEQSTAYLSMKNTLEKNLVDNQNELKEASKTINQVSEFSEKFSNSVAKGASNAVDDNQHLILLFSLVAVVLAVIIAWFAIRSIRLPLAEMNQVLSKISTGDLTQKIVNTSVDEFGLLKNSANKLTESLKDMMQAIKVQSTSVAGSVETTHETTTELKSNIAQQREQTEMVVTAMNEMTMTIKEVAENAQTTFAEMTSASDQAQKSKIQVQENSEINQSLEEEIGNATSVIRTLDNDVSKIEEILQVIESIASQTNLLALNAAIEAARAGEQGRGFAVVADEVRTLAKRTQDSTEEIKANIDTMTMGSSKAVQVMENSQLKTQQAVEMSKQVFESIGFIVETIDNTKNLNLQIATAAEEQSVTAEEINRNIVQISDMAENTAVCSSKNEACIDELSSSAHELENLIKKFQV